MSEPKAHTLRVYPIWGDFNVRIPLVRVSLDLDRVALHQWDFGVVRGSTLETSRILEESEKVFQMYRSTTRGLT